MTLANLTRENFARAAVEGLLCLMAVGLTPSAPMASGSSGCP